LYLPVIPVIRREKMLKKQLTLLFALVLTFPLAAVVLGQKTAKSKEARWEGRVERTSKEQSSLTVRQTGSSIDKACVFDSSTKWVSQYHHDKKVNDIDASQVKEGDYVICKGTEEKSGEIHATVISKRLSHSPN
jgi:RNA polymerase-binding transcription factor DksA